MPYSYKAEQPFTSNVFKRVPTPVSEQVPTSMRSEVKQDLVLDEVRALRREVGELRSLLSPYPGRLLVGPEVLLIFHSLKG